MVLNMIPLCVNCGCRLTEIEMVSGQVCAECSGELSHPRKLHSRTFTVDDLPTPSPDDAVESVD
jgi:hypothetical protein